MTTPKQRVVIVRTQKNLGTGVRITSNLVLTCEHVVGRAEKVEIQGLTVVRVVARDPKADLALLETTGGGELAAAEWTEAIPLVAGLELFGYPGGSFDHVTAAVRATHANDAGMRELELPATMRGGMSGGLAVLENDPLACVGLVQMGESPVLSTLIGAGVIRSFLREKCGGQTLPMRGSATDRQTAEYLRQLREEHGFIDLRKLRIETGSVKHAPLEEIYIPLSTAAAKQPERPGRMEEDAPKTRLLETLLAEQRVLIQGEAGSGKSTFLKRVAYELAGGGDGQLPPLPVSGLFPIFVRVTELEKHKADCGDGEARKLAHFLSARHELDVNFFQRKLQESTTLVLLDGMDESPTMATRHQTMELIERIAVKNPQCRFAITTRPRAGVHLRGFVPAAIEPLTNEAREKFVGDWTRFLFRDGATEAAAKHKTEILAALTERTEIDEMSRNPLMLTALAALYWVRRQLPVVRAELYQAILLWLVEVRPRDGEGERVSGQDCLDYLSELAWGMQLSGTGRREIEKGDAAVLMRMCPSEAKAREFLNREEVDSGIIVSEGTSVKFWHLQFQEFLAARHLAGMDSSEQQYTEILRDGRLYTSEWREVVRLYAGILAACHQSKRKAEAVVKRILDAAGTGLAERARCVALLSAINQDLKPIPFRISDPRYWTMVEGMQDLFRADAERVDLDVKVAAAGAMDTLDRHPLLRLPADPDYWISVPGASFVMGGDPEAYGGKKERPAKVAPFAMGRCPVTVFEYAEYVKCGGVVPDGWDKQRETPSRPVVHVRWDDAQQYCRWVKGVELPTDEQWELAARGKEGRTYPWGNEPVPDEERANFDNNVGATTPVGLFPKGNTPEGLTDMAGNVWEWTASDHEEGGKVVRGGAFDDYARALRGAFRYRYHPVLSIYYIGFRLVRE